MKNKNKEHKINNQEIALKWAKLGVSVFPCHSKDGWANGREISIKAPIPKTGFKEATLDEKAIRIWWEENPEDLVGLYTGNQLVVLDIDVNIEKNKDGWFSLNEKGITPTETFKVKTKNGGDHYFYRNNGVNLGPTVGVKLPNGEILEDVDRRAGGSYVIAWSSEVPETLEDLAIAPDWLTVQAGRRDDREYPGSTTEWLASLTQGAPSPLVRYAIKKFPQDNINHHQLLSVTANLVNLGASGEPGIIEALAEFKALYLRPPFDEPKYQIAFENALAGAIKKFGGRDVEAGKSDFEKVVADKVFEIEARKEAERVVAAKYFKGSRVLTWADLKAAQSTPLVENLVPWEGVTLLVGDSNIGKTFAFIDMACRISLGWKWLGKSTQQANVLFVLGEGKSGFHSRIESWCAFNEVDIDALEPYFSFIDGANLNVDASLETIRSVAEANKSQLIIYDTWAATSGVVDENNAGLTSETVSRVLMSMPDKSHFFSHHPTKASAKSESPIPRGSGSLTGAADLVMTVFHDKNAKKTFGGKDPWLGLSTENAHNGKNRNARTETIRGLRLKSFDDDRVVFYYEAPEDSKKSLANIKKHLVPGTTVKDYMAKTGLSESQARRELNEAVEVGLALKSTSMARNVPVTYSPNNQPKPALLAKEINWNEIVDLAPKPKKGE